MTSEPGDKTNVRSAGGADSDVVTSSSSTQIRPQALDQSDELAAIDDDASDKTVVVGVGLESSNDSTVILGEGESPEGGAPTLTLGDTTVINDRFELLSVLGSGGMGVVFKALDRRKVEAQDRDPYVAIKLLNDDFKVHPHSVISLQREARRSQKLAHPNIVNVHDFDRDGDQVYMTMECLQGQPLDELIKSQNGKSLPLEQAHSILKDMCAAMIHAHNNKIAHSDFKPGNIYVTNAGEAKVLDFGIARAVTSGISSEEAKTENTLFDPSSLGALTPAYASREMLIGELPEIVDDVYAVGCVAYELFTGQHPFKKKNAVDAKKAGMRPARVKSLTTRQWKALRKALSFRREERFASVIEFWEAFDSHVSPVWLLAGIVMLTAVGVAFWSVQQSSQIEGVDEEAIRLQADIDNAYRNLTAWIERDPISRVEKDLRASYEAYRALAGGVDDALLSSREKIVDRYLLEAEALRASGQFADAKSRLETSVSWNSEVVQQSRYQTISANIAGDLEAERLRLLAEEKARKDALEAERLVALRAEQDRLAEQKAAKALEQARERELQYQQTLAKVDALLSCQAVPSFNELEQSMKTLKQLDSSRYDSSANGFAESLAVCVKRIGASNPIAGKAAQRSALALFPSSAVIASVVIDPCANAKLTPGSGRRESKFCYDQVAAVSAPKMVVVPGVGGAPSYAIGKYELSAKEFGAYCQAGNDCNGVIDTSSDLPVRQLSVNQAKAYAAWISAETGFDYRIPTLNEWMNAAKASGREKNLDPNCTVKRVNGTRAGDALRVQGGTYNDWGLYNVVGNVREWVLDNGSLAAVGGRHTDRLADKACSLASVQSHDGSADATTGLRLVRDIKR